MSNTGRPHSRAMRRQYPISPIPWTWRLEPKENLTPAAWARRMKAGLGSGNWRWSRWRCGIAMDFTAAAAFDEDAEATPSLCEIVTAAAGRGFERGARRPGFGCGGRRGAGPRRGAEGEEERDHLVLKSCPNPISKEWRGEEWAAENRRLCCLAYFVLAELHSC